MRWQLQEAKQRFGEIVRRAHDDGPQVVTRHGEEVAVVLSAPDLAALDLRHRSEQARTVELDDDRAG